MQAPSINEEEWRARGGNRMLIFPRVRQESGGGEGLERKFAIIRGFHGVRGWGGVEGAHHLK